jgi:hypothetical protein
MPRFSHLPLLPQEQVNQWSMGLFVSRKKRVNSGDSLQESYRVALVCKPFGISFAWFSVLVMATTGSLWATLLVYDSTSISFYKPLLTLLIRHSRIRRSLNLGLIV